MKTKKFEYLFETMNLKRMLIIIDIICVIIAAVVIYFNKYALLIFPAVLFIFLNMAFKSVFAKHFNQIKNKKNILKSGQEYDGKIIGYKTVPLLSQLISFEVPGAEMAKSIDSNTWVLVIEYNNKTFETPAIVYNPATFFASDKCKVYSNGVIEYATMFDVAVDENHFDIPEIKEEIETNETSETNESENNA